MQPKLEALARVLPAALTMLLGPAALLAGTLAAQAPAPLGAPIARLEGGRVSAGAPGEHLPRAAGLLNAQHKRGSVLAPDERWEQRSAITRQERNRMHRLVRTERERAREDRGIALDATLTHACAAAVDRHAVPAALMALGVVEPQKP